MCARCRSRELGWTPPPGRHPGPVACTQCSGTGWKPAEPAPETWHEWAVGVRLTPWRSILETRVERRYTAFRRAQEGRKYGEPMTADRIHARRFSIQAEACGEAAVALLLGGHASDDGVVTCPSGLRVKAKTAWRGFPFKRWQPSFFGTKRGGGAKLPHVLAVTRAAPECFDMAWVVGVVPASALLRIRSDFRHAFWAGEPWERIEPLMQDELAEPWAPVGTVGRRYAADRGFDVGGRIIGTAL